MYTQQVGYGSVRGVHTVCVVIVIILSCVTNMTATIYLNNAR